MAENICIKNSYFRSFFLSRWWSSRPSERLFKWWELTWDVSRFPNQQTKTFEPSLSNLTSFPGHDGNVPWGPQTSSPTLNVLGTFVLLSLRPISTSESRKNKQITAKPKIRIKFKLSFFCLWCVCYFLYILQLFLEL